MRLLFQDFSLPYLLRDSEFPAGGWAVELKCWLEALAASGHQAGVLTWKGGAAYAAGKSGLCDLLDTYDPNKGIRILKYFYSYIPTMMSVARDYRPDCLIQACAGVDTGIMAYIAKRLHVPFVYRVSSDADTDGRLSAFVPQRYARAAYNYGLRNASAILCQNRYQFEQLELLYPKASFRIIHNPFIVADKGAGEVERNERGYIAWLAVFRDAKNLPLLLRLARRLPSIRFRVAGMPGKNPSKSVTEAIAALQAQPNVEMMGYVRRNEVLAFLSKSVALLSTSDTEGFSNTFLEALSVGTPLVLRRQVDPDMIVSTRDLGFAANDEEDLARCLGEVWSMDQHSFKSLSRRCERYVRTHHDPAVKVEELMTVLCPIVERAGVRTA
jgi:glycosyltransferase involved in cell wall biosynthesis